MCLKDRDGVGKKRIYKVTKNVLIPLTQLIEQPYNQDV